MFNINDPDGGSECTFSKFVDDRKLVGVVHQMAVVLFTRASVNWRNGLTRISQSETKGNAKSCSWAGTTAGVGAG